MASSLSSQLAQIAAKSSNPLDLKAQKKAHSQSLVFDEKRAANQGFETIYQICLEGFQELCQLDSRYTAFARSIFSTQSQTQDRNQMTKSENEKLNGIIDSFLCLVSAKLLLKPAHLAVEWLIRRFRVHEHSTTNLVLAFLPYHSLPVFVSLLRVLPRNQPPALRWLHQYVVSTVSPPKDAVVYAAAHNRDFFSAYNTFILQSCHESYHDRALISCWAVVTTGAVASMMDQAKSGRREIKERNEQDVLTQILPLLDEGLALRDVNDMRVACYMILTVVASKIQLRVELLDALMAAVTSSWSSDTTHAGLICIAVLTHNKKDVGLARNVFDAILSIETLTDDLSTLKEKYRIDRLVLGLLQGVLAPSRGSQKSSGMKFVVSVFENSLLDMKYCKMAIKVLLSAANNVDPTIAGSSKFLGQLADLIQGLSSDEAHRPIVLGAIQDDNIDLEHLQAKLQTNLQLEEDISQSDVEVLGEEKDTPDEDFQKSLQHVPTHVTQEVSFLAQLDSYLFASLVRAFVLCTKSTKDLSQFCNLSVLGRLAAMDEPRYLSFFFRVACSSLPATARVTALQCLNECLEEAEPITDLQMFYPYLLFTLSDPVSRVRTAAVNLASTLLVNYRSLSESHKGRETLILGKHDLYGSEKADLEPVLPFANSLSFVGDILGPVLDECRLDAEHASRRVDGFLRDSLQAKYVPSDAKAFRKSSRMFLLQTLTSHIIATPLYSVKLRLLSILHGVGRIGHTSRTKCLKPLIEAYRHQDQQQFRDPLVQARINDQEYARALIGTLAPSDNEGLELLHQLVDPERGLWPPQMQTETHHHIRSSWTKFKDNDKVAMVEHLFDLASKDSGKQNDLASSQALETLQNVAISTIALVSILENLSRLSEISRSPSNAKRRRTSHGQDASQSIIGDDNLEANLRAMTIALELVESSKEAQDEHLLPALFQVLEDVLHSKSVLGAGLGYVLSLVLGCIRSVMETIKDFQPRFDQSRIRADLVVDGLKASTTPQSQNTALLLLAKLATVAPDLVVHTVMPIFTFMGSSMVNQTDEFSVHVIDKTIDSVVPPLLQSLRKKETDILAGTSELLLSFVAAFEHMPLSRRLHLFELLINKLGPRDSLHAVLAMLVDKYRDDKDVHGFATDLASHYEIGTQLVVMQRYIELVVDSLSPKPSMSRTISLGEDTTPAANAARLLKLARGVFSNSNLKSGINKLFFKSNDNHAEPDSARSCYSMILESLLYINVQSSADKNLLQAIDGVLRALLDLFPVQEYSLSLQNLLGHENLAIRRQAMSSLELRLSSMETGRPAASKAVLGILPTLTSLLNGSDDSLLKAASLACMTRIIAQFGKKDTQLTLNTAKTLIGESGLGSTDLTVVTGSLECLSMATSILGEAIVPIVPDVSVKVIGHLKTIIDEELEEEDLHDAAYGFFGSLLKHLPWIVSGKNLDDFLKVSYGSANAELGSGCDQARKKVLDLLAQVTDHGECFAALKRTWQTAVAEGPRAIKDHFSVLETATRVSKKSTLVKHSTTLVDTILLAFDLRRMQLCPRTENSYEDGEVDEAESRVNEVAVNMIYKLSDDSFGPMFSRMQEWSITLPHSGQSKDARLYRQTAWYKFLHLFFERIQAIGVHYAGYIVEQSNALLQPSMTKTADSLLLLNTVISTLGAAFKYDKDEYFQSHSSYIPVFGISLIALIPNASLLPPLQPAIVSLAACTTASEQRKMLNSAILQHFKSQEAATRLAAVKVQRGITEQCGEDWVTEVMAETSAAIVELREDDSEEVEGELARWEKELEPILGEEYAEMLG